MRRRTILIAGLLAVACVMGAAYLGAPFLTPHEPGTAAKAGDRDRLAPKPAATASTGAAPKTSSIASAESAAPPSTAPTSAEPLPKVGDCWDTRVADAGPRLEGIPDSGSSVSYEGGKHQVTYDVIPGIAHSRVGDPVRLCVTAVPDDCPPGDNRGVVYHATNGRTGESWDAPDSEHECGGA